MQLTLSWCCDDGISHECVYGAASKLPVEGSQRGPQPLLGGPIPFQDSIEGIRGLGFRV